MEGPRQQEAECLRAVAGSEGHSRPGCSRPRAQSPGRECGWRVFSPWPSGRMGESGEDQFFELDFENL